MQLCKFAVLSVFLPVLGACGAGDDGQHVGLLEATSSALDETVAGPTTRYPIVLHHGFGGGHAGILSYYRVSETLRADGHVVAQTEAPPFDGIEVRVRYLREVVDAVLTETGATHVNIIAHSLGGLDARHLISALGYGDRVASLTTISTPHRGTHAADFALAALPGVFDPVVDALAQILGAQISNASQDTSVRAGLVDLSEARATAFNAQHPDDARVFYQSWAGVSSALGLAIEQRRPDVIADCEGELLMKPGSFDRLRPVYLPVAPIVGHSVLLPAPNDGLVSVTSARWGEFHGCIPADHSEEVGRYFPGHGPNLETGFDHLRFYRELASELARRGY